MDERIMQFRVGVVVFATLFIAGILIMMFSEISPFQDEYTFQIQFPSAPGVTKDTPIRKSGILIGRVTEVEIIDEGVMVGAEVNARYRLRRNEVPRIGSASLLGDSVVEFIDSGMPRSNEYIEDGDVVRGIVAVDPFQVISRLEEGLGTVVTSVTQTSNDFGALSRQLSQLVDDNDENLARVMQKMEFTLEKVAKLADNADSLLGDEQMRANLHKAIEDLPQLVEDARGATQSIKNTFARVDNTFTRVDGAFERMDGTFDRVDRNLDNIEKFTKPLSERGENLLINADRLVTNLNRSAGSLESVMRNVTTFTEKLNSSDGTFGRLMNDPQLYDNLTEATQNINLLTVELRPVVHDARVFADKIARNPELLGVRGAIEGSNGSKTVRRTGTGNQGGFFNSNRMIFGAR